MNKLIKILATAALAVPLLASAASYELLNVSYDPTRELYEAYNKHFSSGTRPRPVTPSSSSSRTAVRASRPVP